VKATEHWYVCSPNSFRLCAKEDLSKRKTTVVFYVGKKRVHGWAFRSHLQNYGDKTKLDDLVRNLIKNFMSRDKKYVQEKFDFLAQTVYTQLKEVQTKLGTLIWRR